MLVMTFLLRWSWVLGIALFLPVTLPAGGPEKYQSKIHFSKKENSFLISNCSILRTNPSTFAPSLRTLQIGTSVKILRKWRSSDNKKWLQVQIASNEIMELPSAVRRGWLNV